MSGSSLSCGTPRGVPSRRRPAVGTGTTPLDARSPPTRAPAGHPERARPKAGVGGVLTIFRPASPPEYALLINKAVRAGVPGAPFGCEGGRVQLTPASPRGVGNFPPRPLQPWNHDGCRVWRDPRRAKEPGRGGKPGLCPRRLSRDGVSKCSACV